MCYRCYSIIRRTKQGDYMIGIIILIWTLYWISTDKQGKLK